MDVSHRYVSLALLLLLASCGPANSPVPVRTPAGTALSPAATAQPLLPVDTPGSSPQPRPTLPPRTAVPTSQPPTVTPPSAPSLGPFQFVPLAAGRPKGAIRDLRAGPDGTLWLVADEGVGTLKDGTWTLQLDRPGLLAGFSAGRAWLAPGDGKGAIGAWDGSTWTWYGVEAGWTGPEGDSKIAFGENPVTGQRGWVWLTTGRDVRAFDGTRWTIHPIEEIGFASEEPGFMRLDDVAVDSSGDVWVGECESWGPGPWGDGARWFDGQSWGGANSPVVGSASGCVSDIEVDAAGRIWVGGRGKLWRYTPGAGWSDLGAPADPSVHHWGAIYRLTLDPQGNAWMVLEQCGGASCDIAYHLYRLAGDDWTPMGLALRHIDLAFAPDGTAWTCLDGTVYRSVGDTLERIATADAEPCLIEVDAAGRVWVAVPQSGALYGYTPPR